MSGEGVFMRRAEGGYVEGEGERPRARGTHLCTTRRAHPVRIRRGRPRCLYSYLFTAYLSAAATGSVPHHPLPASQVGLRGNGRLMRGGEREGRGLKAEREEGLSMFEVERAQGIAWAGSKARGEEGIGGYGRGVQRARGRACVQSQR